MLSQPEASKVLKWDLRWSVWSFSLKDCSKSERSVCRCPAEDLVSTAVLDSWKCPTHLQLWFKMHCAKWKVSRCSLSLSCYPSAETLSSILSCWPRYGVGIISDPKPIWWKGAPQRKGPCSLETLGWRNTPSYSSSPLLILVQPWGSSIASSSMDWKVFQVRHADLSRNHASFPQQWHWQSNW